MTDLFAKTPTKTPHQLKNQIRAQESGNPKPKKKWFGKKGGSNKPV